MAILSCLLIIRKDWLKLLSSGITALSAIGTAYLIFPAMMTHLTQTNRGEETFNNLSNIPLTYNIGQYLGFIHKELLGNIPWPFLLVLALISLLIFSLNHKRWYQPGIIDKLILVSFPTLGYFIIVQIISHYLTPRYIYLIYPQIILILGCVFFGSWTHFERWAKYLIPLVAGSFIVFNHYQPAITYTYPQQEVISKQVSPYQDYPAIMITDKKWKTIQLLTQIKDHPKVYPWVPQNIYENSFPVLESNQKNVLIYFDFPGIDMATALALIEKAYPPFESQIIYQQENLIIIQCQKAQTYQSH